MSLFVKLPLQISSSVAVWSDNDVPSNFDDTLRFSEGRCSDDWLDRFKSMV